MPNKIKVKTTDIIFNKNYVSNIQNSKKLSPEYFWSYDEKKKIVSKYFLVLLKLRIMVDNLLMISLKNIYNDVFNL